MKNIKITVKLEKSQIDNTIWLIYTYLDYNKVLKINDFYPKYIRFTKVNNIYISKPCIIENNLIDYLYNNNIAITLSILKSDWRRFKLTPTGLIKLI
jgi:hypothetical protein